MALSNITLSTTKSNISVDVTNTTVSVGQTVANVTLAQAVSTRFIEDVFTVGASSGNVSLDLTNGTIQNLTQTGDITGLIISNLDTGSSMTLVIGQDGIGGHTLDTTTYASNWTSWEFVNDYTQFDTNPSNYNIINLFNNGSNIYASLLTETAPPVQNSDLANSNITVNGTTFNLGDTGNIANFGPLTTNDLTEGNTNLYYTDTRSRSAISLNSSAGALRSNGTLSYDNGTGVFTFTSAGVPQTTSDLPEGTNLYYTTARVNDDINAYSGDLANLTGNVTTTAAFNATNIILQNNSLTFVGFNNNSSVITGAVDLDLAAGNISGFNLSNLEQIRLNDPGNDGIWIQGQSSSSTRTLSLGRNISMLGASNLNMHSFDLHTDADCANINMVIYPLATGTNQSGVLNTAHIYNPGNTMTNYHTGTNLLDIRSVGNIDLNSAGTVATVSSTGIHTTSNVTAGNVISTGIASFGSNVNQTHTFTGNLDVTGNIEVSGNLNYRNVEDLYVRDQSITLNANAATDATSSIIINRPVAGSNTVLRWNETSDKWQFSNDGSTYQDLIGLTNLSVSTAAASGGGALSYSNTTGVFTFTPADLTGAITNAQAQAYIQENGLTMTAGISSNANITTTANMEANYFIATEEFIGDLEGAISEKGYNNTGSTLTRGSAVYINGAQGDQPNIALANSESVAHMPAVGIVKENIGAGATGQFIVSGVMNYASHGFTTGAELFVNSAGVLQETAPTGEANLIQKIGKVVGPNHILVQGAGRTNATPNLDANSIFIGNSTNQASTVNLNALSSSIITDKRLEGDRFSGGNVVVPIEQYLTSVYTYIKFSSANDPHLPNGTKILIQDTDANNPLANGSINSDNIFYTRKVSTPTYYILYLDEGLQTASTASVPATAPANANVTFGSVLANGPITMSSGVSGLELEIGSNAYTYDQRIRNDLTIGETALRNSKLDLSGDATITNYSGNAALTLVNNINSATVPTQLVMKQNKNAGTVAGVAGDELSVLQTQGMTSNTSIGTITYANVVTKITDPTEASEDAEIDFRLKKAGNEESIMLLKSTEMDLNVPINSDSNITTTGDVSTDKLILPDGNNGIEATSNSDFNLITAQMDASTDVGIEHLYKKSRGGGVVQANDRIIENEFYSHDGTDYIKPLESHVYVDPDASLSIATGTVPLAWEIHGKTGGNTNAGVGTVSMLRVTNDRNIVFNDSGSRGFGTGTGNANITADGTFNTVANINATGNISGNYILGNGSALSGIVLDTFNQVKVSGQSNVDASGASALTFAESGGITITTDAANNTVTIDGAAANYDDSNVISLFNSYANVINSTANIETTARVESLNLNAGSNTLPISILYGSGSVGIDYIQMNTSIDPRWIDSTPVVIGDSDATNPFANGSVSADNTYFVARHSTIAGLYVLYADAGMTTLSNSGATTIIGTTANVTFKTFNVTSNHAVNGYPYGAVYSKTFESGGDVKAANAVFADNILPYTSGATFTLNSVRVTDFKANDPLGIVSVANSSLGGGVYAAPFDGSIVFVTGDRVVDGDGVPAYWSGNAWKYFSDDANVTI